MRWYAWRPVGWTLTLTVVVIVTLVTAAAAVGIRSLIVLRLKDSLERRIRLLETSSAVAQADA